MRYSHLLSVPISTGILLCVWVITEKSATIGRAADVTSPSPTPQGTVVKGAVHDGPFGNYVKHNPGFEIQSSKAAVKHKHADVDPWIFVELISEDGGKSGYIQYSITDGYGIPTNWHSIYTRSINESPDSSLFSTKLDYTKDVVVWTGENGEVQITGTEYLTNKPLAWTSASKAVNTDDGDVTWSP
jgi:hypothetical protein